MSCKKIHFGAWLRREIARSGKPFSKFASDIDVATSTLYRWFDDAVPAKMREYNLQKVAQVLGYSFDHVKSIFLAAMRDDPATNKRWAAQLKALEGADDFASQLVAIEDLKKQGMWDDEAELNLEEQLGSRGVKALPVVLAWFKSLAVDDRNAVLAALDATRGSRQNSKKTA